MSRLNTDATTNIVLTQAAMVMLTLFGGGTFIPWNSTPIYWVWLQEISLFTQSSRSAIMHVMSFIDFKCTSLTMASNGICVSQIGLLACDAQSTDGESCYVKGRTVLHSLQGSSRTDSPWIAAGYLVLIFVTFRLGILFLMCFPADRLFAIFKQFWSNRNDKQILKELTDPRRIEGLCLSSPSWLIWCFCYFHISPQAVLNVFLFLFTRSCRSVSIFRPTEI